MPQRSTLRARTPAQSTRRPVAGGWSIPFQRSMSLIDGTVLETLEDAAKYILAMPPGKSAYDEWQHTMKSLMAAAQNKYDPALVEEARRRMERALFMAAKFVEAD